ncbi:MAG: hypothetical protein WA720_07220 [Pseudolabrys sp.]
MKLGIPAILIAALVVASPAAFAQNMGYTGTTSKPGAGFDKDDANLTKQSKKHMASHKKKHSAKHMTSKPQTTGSGSASTGAGDNKDETTPKSRYHFGGRCRKRAAEICGSFPLNSYGYSPLFLKGDFRTNARQILSKLAYSGRQYDRRLVQCRWLSPIGFIFGGIMHRKLALPVRSIIGRLLSVSSTCYWEDNDNDDGISCSRSRHNGWFIRG